MDETALELRWHVTFDTVPEGMGAPRRAADRRQFSLDMHAANLRCDARRIHRMLHTRRPSMNQTAHRSLLARMAPALTLIVLAPLITEVLPGSTRMSSIFVFPIEMGVWGVGALFIREVVRRRQLGWPGMLLLALVLAIAEECMIQQSSLAPLVFSIQHGGDHYARAGGVNYLYLLWALGYESVFVVLVPVAICELVFRERRQDAWLSRGGMIASTIYFLIACVFAWFTWTQIARVKVFHVAAFVPPLWQVLVAALVMLLLVVIALRMRTQVASPTTMQLPAMWLVAASTTLLACLWYGLVVLAFGARPQFPPLLAVLAAVVMVVIALLLYPRWSSAAGWNDRYRYTTAATAVIANMAVGFVGFIGASALDFYGKLVLDVMAVVWLVWLGCVVFRSSEKYKY
jgi:hypothetical protein